VFVTPTYSPSLRANASRHGRIYSGHPRFCGEKKDVDGLDKPGHDALYAKALNSTPQFLVAPRARRRDLVQAVSGRNGSAATPSGLKAQAASAEETEP